MGQSGNPAKRAEQEQAEAARRAEYDALALEAGQLEDFDQFWQDVERKPNITTIMGERVELPPSLPLRFELEARRLQRSRSDRDVRTLVGILFGNGDLEAGAELVNRWAEKGMDADQFMVLLAWAPQVIAGQKVTLAQVREQLSDQETPDPS